GIGQSNVIPSSARLTLDVRLTPGPDGSAVAREIDAACQRAMARRPGVTIEWAPVNGFRFATRVERGEPLVRAVVSAVRRVTGRPARFSGVPGSTDGTILRTTLEPGTPLKRAGDRKSTRLNSSHVSISYAVFCLKKKKKQKTLT